QARPRQEPRARRDARGGLRVAAPRGARHQEGGVRPRSRRESKEMKVQLTTSQGTIVIELDEAKAPISSENFLKYVDAGHYDGTIFHRVIDGFMIQGGGFTKDMGQKPINPPIKNESTNGLKNDNYTVAMARTNVRDSATSQFFINVKDNDFLNFAG